MQMYQTEAIRETQARQIYRNIINVDINIVAFTPVVAVISPQSLALNYEADGIAKLCAE